LPTKLGNPPYKPNFPGFGIPSAPSTSSPQNSAARFLSIGEKPIFAISMAKNLAQSVKIGHYDGMKCEIQIFVDGAWRTAAAFETMSEAEVAKGIQGAGFLEYDVDFAGGQIAAARPAEARSP
jgi:hypothetical protein